VFLKYKYNLLLKKKKEFDSADYFKEKEENDKKD
jgi:hypothetical protein